MNVKHENYSETLRTAERLIEGATDNGGITLSRYGLPVIEAQGYAVGGACVGFSVSSNPEHIGNCYLPDEVARWIQAQPGNIAYFGSWLNPEDNRVYFDGIDIIDEYTDAVLTAFERGEQAIWNLATNECEYVAASEGEGSK